MTSREDVQAFLDRLDLPVELVAQDMWRVKTPEEGAVSAQTASTGTPYSTASCAGTGVPRFQTMPHCPHPIHACGPRMSWNAATSRST